MIQGFIQWLMENNWKIKYIEQENKIEIKDFMHQYNFLDALYLEFLDMVEECVGYNETIWFNCAKEFLGKADTEFRWNEFEILSLESAGRDENWKLEIENFWKRHLPIILSVAGEYMYYALRDDGKIVVGYEPEFEETEVISNSFYEFIRGIMDSKILL